MRLFTCIKLSTASICRLLIPAMLFVMFSSSPIISKENANSDTLAVVGKFVLTENIYIESYNAKLKETGLSDNVEIRQKYLHNLVNDAIIIEEARRRGYDKKDDADLELKRIKIQELLNAYSLRHISPSINVTENDLKELFVKFNTKIKVSHLFAPTREKIDSLYAELKHGASFEQLAYNNFEDPVLKKGYGSLGYISIDEMDPEFERTAFSMKPGEISQPVKTIKGYSIIRVEDIKSNPLLSENEYLKARDNLLRFARKRVYEKEAKHFSESLGKKLNVQLDKAIIYKLFDQLKADFSNNFIEKSGMYSQSDLKQIAITSELGEWTLQELLNEMSISTEKMTGWIRNRENLTDFIKGLVNRKYIVQQAIEQNLDSTSEYVKNVAFKFDSYLLSRIEEDLKSKLSVSSEEIIEHYNNYNQDFMTEPTVRISLILTDSKKSAVKVENLLLEGQDFAQLAKKYSIQSLTAVNGGDAGYFKKEDLDYLGDDILELFPGEWKGPYNDDDKYVFIKCTEKLHSELKPLAEVESEIKQMLISLKWFDERNTIISKFRGELNVKVYPEKLIHLKL